MSMLNAKEDKEILDGLINWYTKDIDDGSLVSILNRRLENSGHEAVQNFVLYKAALAIGERLFNKPENEAAMFLAVAIMACTDGSWNFDEGQIAVDDNKIILNLDGDTVEVTVHTNPLKLDIYVVNDDDGMDNYESLDELEADYPQYFWFTQDNMYIIRTAEDTVNEVLK